MCLRLLETSVVAFLFRIFDLFRDLSTGYTPTRSSRSLSFPFIDDMHTQKLSNSHHNLPLSYEGLLHKLAVESEGFSGASLAGVARAAASHALERAVEESIVSDSPSSTIMECLVRQEDFYEAIKDLANSQVDVDGRFQDHSEVTDDVSSSSASSRNNDEADEELP